MGVRTPPPSEPPVDQCLERIAIQSVQKKINTECYASRKHTIMAMTVV